MSHPQKPLSHAPKNPARRSKEERERLDKLETQRRQARADASAADAAAESARRRAYYGIQRDPPGREGGSDAHGAYRGGLGGSLRYVRGGRGGFMGQKNPLQRSQPAEKNKADAPSTKPAPSSENTVPTSVPPRRTTRRSGVAVQGAQVAESGPAKPEVKEDPDGDITMRGTSHQTAKSERDYGYVSSDDEVTLGKNIEYINLVSDDEFDAELPEESTSADPSRRRVTGFQPLRLLRKPHRDRGVQILPDANSGTRSRRERGEKARAAQDITSNDATLSDTRKGKGRSKDTHVRQSGASIAGVKERDIVSDSSATVKEEGQSAAAEGSMRNDENRGGMNTSATAQSIRSDTETKDAVDAKIRSRRRTLQAAEKRTAFQTVEEQRENEKWRQDLEDVQNELGYLVGPDVGDGESVAGPAHQSEEGFAEAADAKENTVYLFQLPPVIPDLLEPTVKQETQSPEVSARPAPAPSRHPNNPATSGPIKVEDDSDGPKEQNTNENAPRLDPGKVGKFRVHESGRATLTWGGITMEVSQGINPHFLQSVILANYKGMASGTAEGPIDVDAASTGDAAGEATCFGQVRGKLVVTPDWSEMLG